MQSSGIVRAAARRVHAQPPSRASDLVGPADALTNLRPVYYVPRYTSPSPTASTRKLHPYSLDEFSSPSPPSSSLRPGSPSSTSTTRAANKLARLEALRQRYEALDLAYRLEKRRLDAVSHAHWAATNAAFLARRGAAEQAAAESAALSSLTPSSPSPSPSSSSSSSSIASAPASTARSDPAVMQAFLRHWVADNAAQYETYQRAWMTGIFRQIRADAAAQLRQWRWAVETWRAGVA